VNPAPTVVLTPAALAADVAGRWQPLHDVARDDGLAAGFRALQAAVAPAGVPCGPAGHVVTLAGIPCPGDSQDEQAGQIALGADTFVVARGPVATAVPEAWALGLSWVRLGTSRWLLRRCVEHARGRQVGDGSLLQQQLVMGAVADALIEQLEAQSLLAGGGDPGAELLSEANAAIVTADRLALGLLGASGFAQGLDSCTAWVSELLADAFIGSPGLGGHHDRAR